MPCIQVLSHNLKEVAGRHNVVWFFSARNKLQKVCPHIYARGPQGCIMQRESPFIKCSIRVVYSIPLSREKIYIGQAERCHNDCLKVNKGEDKHAHLAAHVTACDCEPRFKETRFLHKSKSCTAQRKHVTLHVVTCHMITQNHITEFHMTCSCPKSHNEITLDMFLPKSHNTMSRDVSAKITSSNAT